MRTSVSHAALLVGATPVLVAIIAALRFRGIARPAVWAGYAVSLAGVCLVAGAAGGGATMTGDGLVLVSLLLSAAFTVAQTRLLAGRDPLAVTALQFLAATVAVLPVAALTEGLPPVAGAARGLPITVALALGGTLLPFALFAFGQSRVPAATAAPFLNLEPLVGAAVGVVVFGDPFGLPQIAGAAAIVAGIAVSSVPLTGRPVRRLLWRARPATAWSGHEEHPPSRLRSSSSACARAASASGKVPCTAARRRPSAACPATSVIACRTWSGRAARQVRRRKPVTERSSYRLLTGRAVSSLLAAP